MSVMMVHFYHLMQCYLLFHISAFFSRDLRDAATSSKCLLFADDINYFLGMKSSHDAFLCDLIIFVAGNTTLNSLT